MSSEWVVQVANLSKSYQIYEKPVDRLKQFIFPKIQGYCGSSVKQYYKEFQALNDVSFSLKKGETLGVIGRNGSGKSTLLQAICGTLTPSSGSVVTKGRIAALLELGSGFNSDFTGRENVYLSGSILGLTKKEIDNRFQLILDFADIGEFIDRPVKTYSSGMMLRLAFAVIAHVDADLLIIDEALAVGDAFFTQKCMRFLRNFMEHGTVIFVSHDTPSVINLCDRAIWLNQGDVMIDGLPKFVCEKYLEAFFEANQGQSFASQPSKNVKKVKNENYTDQRKDFINNSNLRNDIEVFQFKEGSPSFGKGGVRIENVQLLDELRNSLSYVVGGEKVTLRVVGEVYEKIASPILGFYVKDRLGQAIFGDNTYLSTIGTNIELSRGDNVVGEFQFYMPFLPEGDYSITIAFADGTQEEHIQHHWVHDALLMKSISNNFVSGLVGIPMLKIELKRM